jgi:hypothetical protein
MKSTPAMESLTLWRAKDQLMLWLAEPNVLPQSPTLISSDFCFWQVPTFLNIRFVPGRQYLGQACEPKQLNLFLGRVCC